MKVVLDTNVLISGIFWSGAPHTILREWQSNKFEVVVSKKILDEYISVLHRIDAQGDIAKAWSVFIIENVSIEKDQNILQLSRDPHDNKFINTAITGGADYIVTGDGDLLSVKDKSPVKIITPASFLKVL